MWKRKKEAERAAPDDDDDVETRERDIWDINFIISLSLCLDFSLFFFDISFISYAQSIGRIENYLKVWK